MPTYEHLCGACNKEFEDVYSINSDPPEICPLCNVSGQVKRLISGGSGRGIVELTGNDLAAHLRSEGKKLAASAGRDEKLLANLVGEDRYHQNQTNRSK